MHIEKYKNAQVSGIVGHIKREHLYYSNENVDLSLSHNNTIFTSRDMKYYEKRLKELYIYGGWNEKNKLKYNSVCNIAVHCPKDCKNKERFFKIMNFVLEKKYGKDNVICSIVHNDERDINGNISPHLHFSFIPCVYNEKKKKYQLSYEKLMAHGFNSFHKEIEDLIKEYFPHDIIKLHDESNKDRFYFENIKEYKEYKMHLDIVKSNITRLTKMLADKKEELAKVDFQLDEAIQLLTETNQKLNNIFGAKSLDEQIKNASLGR